MSVEGEIDSATQARVLERLAWAFDEDPAGIDLDLSQVTFLDSTGLRMLLTVWERGRMRNVPVRLVRPSVVAVRAIRVAGFSELFGLHGRREDRPAPG